MSVAYEVVSFQRNATNAHISGEILRPCSLRHVDIDVADCWSLAFRLRIFLE